MPPYLDPTIWQCLSLEPTADVRQIKRAYASALKTCHPEEDPEGFAALRKAYEMALEFADTMNRANSLESSSAEDVPSRASHSPPHSATPAVGLNESSDLHTPDSGNGSHGTPPASPPELPPRLVQALQNLQTADTWQEGLDRLDPVFREGTSDSDFASLVFARLATDTQDGLIGEPVLAEMAQRWFFRDDQLECFFPVSNPHRNLMTEKMRTALIAPITANLNQLHEDLRNEDFNAMWAHLQDALSHSAFDHLLLRQWFRLELMRFFSNHLPDLPPALLVELPKQLIWDDLRPFQSQADEVLAAQLEQGIHRAELALRDQRVEAEQTQRFTRFSNRFLLWFLFAAILAFILLGMTKSCFSPAPNPEDRLVQGSSVRPPLNPIKN